jgi:hypothetical protein
VRVRTAAVVILAVSPALIAPGEGSAVAPGAMGPIAFERLAPGESNTVWVTNPDGSHAAVLARGGVLPVHWSPDGRQLTFVDGEDCGSPTRTRGRGGSRCATPAIRQDRSRPTARAC